MIANFWLAKCDKIRTARILMELFHSESLGMALEVGILALKPKSEFQHTVESRYKTHSIKEPKILWSDHF